MVVFDTLSEALACLAPTPMRSHATQKHALDPALTDDERDYMARLGARRRLEFATGRHCAQAALAALGANAGALGRRGDGRALWPQGVVGSISHCDGACVAIVARQEDFAAVGVDVEPSAPLEAEVTPMIASAHEITALPYEAFPAANRPPLDKALFSAKESVFKAVYPRVEVFFDFHDVELRLAADGSFAARLQPALAKHAGLVSVTGRFALTPHHVLTVACVRKAPAVAA